MENLFLKWAPVDMMWDCIQNMYISEKKCNVTWYGSTVIPWDSAVFVLSRDDKKYKIQLSFTRQSASLIWLIDWSLFPLIQTRSTIIWTHNMKQKQWKPKWIWVTKITQWKRNRTEGLFVFTGWVVNSVQWVCIHNIHTNMATHIDMFMGICIHSHIHIPMCTSIWIV